MRELPKELQIFRHFKGALYQIVSLAQHTEDDEELVVYRSITNPDKVYARPLDMFLSEVDHKKYPDVKAKYRFTLFEEDAEDEKLEKTEEKSDKSEAPSEKCETKKDLDCQDKNKDESDSDDDTKVYKEDGELVLDPYVEKILDSKEYTDKIEAFEMLRGKCTEDMLSTLAMALDIQLSGETIEEKYSDILYCLKMHQKYETNRLR